MSKRIIELRWTCSDCGTKDILGRHKRCPNCGSAREKGEMQMDGLGKGSYGADGRNKAATVTDPGLLKLAKAGADWFCTHCGSGNMGDGDRCSACGGPRYGEADEDHPDFPGDHRKAKTDDGDGEDIAKEYGFSDAVRIEKKPQKKRIDGDKLLRSIADEYDENTEDRVDAAMAREQTRQRKVLLGAVIVSVVLGLLVTFLVWAFQTHDVQGEVQAMSWTQETVLQRWTTFTTGAWEHQTSEQREIPPVSGSGERAGMEKVAGSCHSKHYEDERYVCGSHEECSPKYRTEEYECGETCSDNGNGFASCSPRYCSRSIPDGETCRTVDEYCTRPIYKTWCDYKTQEWRDVRATPASGVGKDTRWPEVETGTLDRLRYRADYEVRIAYQDGEPLTYAYEPGDTSSWLGKKYMTAEQAKAAEKAYLSWSVGDQTVVVVNNLGGVAGVRRGLVKAEKE